MKRLLVLCAGLAVLAVLAAFHMSPAQGITPPTPPGSVVKLVLAKGHGSGVHLGEGYIITAAHVVTTATEVRIKFDDASLGKADVLWVNTANDIALVRLRGSYPQSSYLSCREPAVGEAIVAAGSPLAIEHVRSYGRVSGKPRAIGPWASVFVADLTIIPGNSGGPVFDHLDEIVGIAVGVLVAPMGFSGSLTGLSAIVPASTVCMLLART